MWNNRKGPIADFIKVLEKYGLLSNVKNALESGNVMPKEQWKKVYRSALSPTSSPVHSIAGLLCHTSNVYFTIAAVGTRPNDSMSVKSRMAASPPLSRTSELQRHNKSS